MAVRKKVPKLAAAIIRLMWGKTSREGRRGRRWSFTFPSSKL